MTRSRIPNRGPIPKWCVLDDCGELVWRDDQPDMDSTLVQCAWELPQGEGEQPKSLLYRILLDASNLGATARTIREHRERFGMHEADCVQFCRAVGIYGEKKAATRLIVPGGVPRTTYWICWWAMGSSRPHRATSIDVPKGRGPELWDALVDLWRQARRPTT